ncbi:hypothetical protein Hsw_2005 [Hymenobacter swuensis DY53]|uniref:Uncharacterized protein n=1 Tax=Hymenobacter swuensis DY53 TaxID=1227739 RepID=W8F796_9BACT|nr:hypothetical protein Hsw_2005 [Hymenobacter swuensis DY53]
MGRVGELPGPQQLTKHKGPELSAGRAGEYFSFYRVEYGSFAAGIPIWSLPGPLGWLLC